MSFLLSLVLLMGLALPQHVSAFVPVVPIKSFIRFVPDLNRLLTLAPAPSDIQRWSEISQKAGGTRVVREELARRALPQAVIDDTFLRILVQQNRIDSAEARALYQRLHGIPGFGSALSKSMGASPANTLGHLTEVRMAHQAAEKGFMVRGIGVRFSDPNKRADTDIDVILEKGGHEFAIEAKAYPSDSIFPLDVFRADMLTLKVYKESNPNRKVTTVFWMTHEPDREGDLKLIQSAADHFGVELITALPEVGIHEIDALSRVLR